MTSVVAVTGILIGPIVTSETAHADACTSTAFASPTERAYVQQVTATTWGVTCLEARNAFRNNAFARDRAAHHIVYEGTSFEPSDAFTSELLPVPVRSCTVTTVGRIKSWLGVTLVTFKMSQRFEYNLTRVWPDPVKITPITDSPIYAYDGVVNAVDTWIGKAGVSSFWGHTSERLGRFTGTLGPFGEFGVNPRVVISKEADGNWSTLNDRGLPGCEDDD